MLLAQAKQKTHANIFQILSFLYFSSKKVWLNAKNIH